jgi:hypothetical protein
MNRLVLRRLPAVLTLPIAIALATAAAHAQISVIDIVPQSRSNETGTDSEPSIAVDPSQPLRIAATAFTPDPTGGPYAPIYVSTDGGLTWTLNSIVPGNLPLFGTNDITLRFGGNTGVLYAASEKGGDYMHLNVLRSSDFTLATPMQLLFHRWNEDQPHLRATTVLGGGSGIDNDRVYVGSNRFQSGPQTAIVDRSLDAATLPAPAGFPTNPFIIETRLTSGQDGPPVRPAIHLDGTVYAAFYSWKAWLPGTSNLSTATADVIVVRSDQWGAGTTPFGDLLGSDGLAGQPIVTGITVPWDGDWGLAGNRLVGSNLSIAVDPRSSDWLYVAWADRTGPPGGGDENTIHVRRSTDRGVTWSQTDLVSLSNATNPALAVNSRGTVGLLYQLMNAYWETHFQRSNDDGVTWGDSVLARFYMDPNVMPAPLYLGDYDDLMAVGKDFYGIFSSVNTPDPANFPSGIIFQRDIDSTSHTLRNLANTAAVAPSIDPFVFHVVDTAPSDDYYIRDWTNSPNSADDGVEPSTNPWFMIASDVWNQRSSVAHPFNNNDQPVNDDAGNGLGAAGDNFLFARVHREAAGSTGNVNLHFLYANFGAGLNYQSAGTATVPFSMTSTQETLASGCPWHLNSTMSTHLCIAVEITGPNDPFVPPSLVGTSPGWPVTDLRVINDNNKAQRNIQVAPMIGPRAIGSMISEWAILHNAATFPRTMSIRYEVPDEFLQRPGRVLAQVVGGPPQVLRKEGLLKLDNMQPGENRWLRVTFEGARAKTEETAPILFFEMAGNVALNGFAVAARPSPVGEVLKHDVEMHRSVFARMATLLQSDSAATESRAASALLKQREMTEASYRAFVKEHSPALANALAVVWKRVGWPPISTGAPTGEIATLAAAHLSALNDLDASLTALQLADGDPADILQNVRWQLDLFRKLAGSSDIVRASRAFIDGYGAQRPGNADYPELINSLLDSYTRAMATLPNASALKRAISEMLAHLDSPTALQKAHRTFLLRLQEAVMQGRR